MSLTLILAVLLDHLLGEPKKWHPLVFFGDVANKVEDKLRDQNHSVLKQKCYGFIALLSMAAPISFLVFTVCQWRLLSIVISPVIVYFCIANNSLKQHSDNILQALNANDLPLARKQVSMIVSRQTERMTESDVRKAAIESVLENGADAVFAPIFWFIIAGPAGAVLYRLSNTLDAMWGYKNQRYLHFGWAAARFDDLLNWVPARLTALSYAIIGETTQALRCWKSQAALLESPNAGVVMTSGAGALNIQLGGPAWYHGKLKNKVFFGSEKPTRNVDINRANKLISHSLLMWLVVVIVVEILGFYFA